ncbi:MULTISPECIES: copper resistance CopC family protein [unclassified Pseudoclavibacter]|uniref:copper resistance CopC family protein n=1 Tax=unclassified Pseudoclavibacter TaxID=2615177 RepID=UPI001BA5212E|nr:copper resistance CopC family protein [Pseudoclavibacter sp. Marseille-Q4354]MBS3180356.1 copper resistance protein CopC [Pseudoclavibacter sp. Marseille-Q4354]
MSFDSAPTSTTRRTPPARRTSTTGSTPTTAAPTAPRRLAVTAIALLMACLLGFAGATPARAHDQLIASSPSPDASLDTSPPDITLSYSANIMEIGPMIVLQDAAGRDWATGEPVIDGTTVTSAVDDTLPDGAYTVNWRVVSSDGHPITGTIPFTVGDPTAADAPAAPAPSDPATADRDPTPPPPPLRRRPPSPSHPPARRPSRRPRSPRKRRSTCRGCCSSARSGRSSRSVSPG